MIETANLPADIAVEQPLVRPLSVRSNGEITKRAGQRVSFKVEIIRGIDEGAQIIVHPSKEITEATGVTAEVNQTCTNKT